MDPFLDEIPEFNRRRLEVMQERLKENCVTISRDIEAVTFLPRLILIGTMNLCPRHDQKRH
ncbi:MAG: ATP-binding protein [Planctomycetaceae bacterium]|nr:ATP-binding protein [Planctomycetaceae bacterium]